jgi:hypothetical protein
MSCGVDCKWGNGLQRQTAIVPDLYRITLHTCNRHVGDAVQLQTEGQKATGCLYVTVTAVGLTLHCMAERSAAGTKQEDGWLGTRVTEDTNKLPPPGIEPRLVGCPASVIVTIPTVLMWLCGGQIGTGNKKHTEL